MSINPTVSIICPSYNRQDLLSRAMRSVLDQTYEDFELIVIDDASTDDTEKVVGSFKDERIRYIRLEKNMGAGAARNKGIKASRGKYIAFQDSDDEWLPEKLDKQVVILGSGSQDFGVVYTDMFFLLQDGETRYWHSPTIKRGRLIDPERTEYQVFMLGILSVLVKRCCFDEVGFFDERFPALEDLELFIRLSMRYDFYHIKKPLVKYYETKGISSNRKGHIAARSLLLDKYYDEIKKNKRFLSNQYFLISKYLHSCGDIVEGRRYLLKAIMACPLCKEPLLFQFKNIFGEGAYTKLLKVYRSMKNALYKRILRSLKYLLWDSYYFMKSFFIMLSSEKKKVAVLYVYADRKKYPDTFNYLAKLVKRIHWFEHTIVKIDNFNEHKEVSKDGLNTYDIGGDNSFWEFSGWKKGLEFLHDKHIKPDIIIFANDAFLNYAKKGKDFKYYRSRISSITLNRLNNSVLGHIDSRKESQTLLGYDVSSWIRTNMFVMPYRIIEQLQFPLIDNQTISEILPVKYTGETFRESNHINLNLRMFLENWIMREWPQARTPTIENWALLRSKLASILNERMLTAKIRELDLEIINMNKVSVI